MKHAAQGLVSIVDMAMVQMWLKWNERSPFFMNEGDELHFKFHGYSLPVAFNTNTLT